MKNKWKKMSTTKKNTLEIILALIVLISFLVFRLYSNYKSAKKEQEISNETRIVTDNSRYFTVLSCAEKYINTVHRGYSNDILLTLSSDYKELYNITSSNVFNYVPKLDTNKMYNYSSREMYEKRISKSVVEYFVYGNISETVMDEDPIETAYDLTVILYEDKFLFSIRPGVSL